MSGWGWVVAVAVILAAGLLLYWLLIVAEATYLGPHAVAWTYDLVARRYDRIKQFNARDEAWFVAGPVLRALRGVARPLVLDVATGTGRVPSALLEEGFGDRGGIVGLDLSREMLRRAQAKLRHGGASVVLVRHGVRRLPFDDNAFDAVTCLESLEFMAHPETVLAEMVRVLAPGGTLLVTNRVGREARLLPGRAMGRDRFRAVLEGLGLQQIEVQRWQVSYDLAAAHKACSGPGVGVRWPPASVVRCPACGGRLAEVPESPGEGPDARPTCSRCGRLYRVNDGIIDLTGHG